MRVVLSLPPSEIEFTEALSGGKFPYLLDVSALRIAARAGYISGLGVGESPSLTFTLDNAGNRAADIVGHPLRARCAVYDDADAEYFSGAVSAVAYGRILEVTVEA